MCIDLYLFLKSDNAIPENAKFMTNKLAGVRSSLVLEKICSTNELPIQNINKSQSLF